MILYNDDASRTCVLYVGEPGNKAKTSPPGETTNVSPLAALGVLQHVGHAEPERLTYVTHNLRSLTSSRDQVKILLLFFAVLGCAGLCWLPIAHKHELGHV